VDDDDQGRNSRGKDCEDDHRIAADQGSSSGIDGQSPVGEDERRRQRCRSDKDQTGEDDRPPEEDGVEELRSGFANPAADHADEPQESCGGDH
jgi:hypothetical protein